MHANTGLSKEEGVFPGIAESLSVADPLDAATASLPGQLRAIMQSSFTAPPYLIRPCRIADVVAMHEAASESRDQLCTWMTWCKAGYSIDDARAFIQQSESGWQREESYSFSIIDIQTENFLGSVGINQVNNAHKFANLGYWVRSKSTGKGVATLATRLAARFAIMELGLNRVELLIPTGNVPSQRVAQKAGAVFEGILRQRVLLEGEPHDAALYSFTKSDFLEKKA